MCCWPSDTSREADGKSLGSNETPDEGEDEHRSVEAADAEVDQAVFFDISDGDAVDKEDPAHEANAGLKYPENTAMYDRCSSNMDKLLGFQNAPVAKEMIPSKADDHLF